MKNVFQGTTKIRAAHSEPFPQVPHHDEARCLCGSALQSPRSKTPFVDGVPTVATGQWFGRCLSDCGMGGFYDVVEGRAS